MNWWLVSAYCVFFGGVGAYALYMGQKQRELDRRIAQLRDRTESEK
jgi:CcmD family protein